MRLLHCYSGNLFGGIESMLVTLARTASLAPEMPQEFALCFEGRLSRELREAGAAVHPLGEVKFSRPWTAWRARRRLAALLAERNIDAVVCHGAWPHVLAGPVAVKQRRGLVYWAHDALTGQHWLERFAAKTRPNLVIANSRYTAASVPTVFAGVPLEVVYCPVAPPDASHAAARAATRAEWNAGDDVVIVLACRLEPWKGHALLLAALERLRDVPGWQTWVIGGAQRPHELARLAELEHTVARTGLSERVKFLGQRNDVPRLLAAADIHCQPNAGPEPFGIAFVEALYAGLPVVTTAIGGALEIVDDSCGILVPAGDDAALAESLRRMIGDPSLRSRLGTAGPARATAISGPQSALHRLEQAAAGLPRS